MQKRNKKDVQRIQSVWFDEQSSLPKISSKMCWLSEFNELKQG